MKKIILFIALLLIPISFTDAWWQPTAAQNLTWQWQLNSGDINTSYDVDMYDVDLFDTPQSKIDELHADGRIVICYFSAGSWEDWRSDAGDFAESVKGDDLDGWAGEKWLDIRDASLQPIMQARLDLAVSKNCDGVEPDNIDGYTNTTGFPLIASDQLTYNTWLATEAHSRDLSIGLKNDVDQIDDLVGSFDWALNEQCYQYNECDGYQTFINADKPVFGVEYRVDTDKFCSQANSSGYSWLKKNLDLDAYRFGCEDYIVRNDGGTVLNINLTGSLQNPAFSPDGSKILFTRWRNGYNEGPADLYIYDIASENVTELMSDGNDNVNLPGSSWVGNEITFSSSRDPHDEVFRIGDSATTGAEIKITDRIGGSAKMSYEPSFSHDGQWVVFETHDVDVSTDGIITKYKIDGNSSYINLTDVGDDCRQPNWSPQGDKILYQKLDGGVWDIWTMNIDGTDKSKITSGTGDKTDAVFSEYGNYIIYSSDFETNSAQIYKIPVAGGSVERLTNFAGYDGAPSVSPDRSKIAFESNDNAPDSSNGTKLMMKNINIGTAEWTKHAGGNYADCNSYSYSGGSEGAYDVVIDDSGNAYVVGIINTDADIFGTNLVADGPWDTFITKLDLDGNSVWTKHAYGTGYVTSPSIEIDSMGNLYVTGYFSNDANIFGIDLISNGSYDGYLSKLDNNGNAIWAYNFGGASTEYPKSIYIDDNDDLYITGSFAGTTDILGVTLVSAGSDDIFVAKIDSDGNNIWAKKSGGSGLDKGIDIVTDTTGNVFVTGYFSDVANIFGNVFTEGGGTGGYDIFLAKLDVNGDNVWSKQGGGSAEYARDYGYTVDIDNSGNVYTSGTFQNNADVFGQALAGTSSDNIYIARLNTNGDVDWMKHWTNTSSTNSTDIKINDGNAYITGGFYGTLYADVLSVSSAGGYDIFYGILDIVTGDVSSLESWGNTSTDTGEAMAFNDYGKGYLVGRFKDTLNMTGNSLTSYGCYDVFVSKIKDESISDIVAPIVTEVTPVSTPTNDNTSDYTFNTDEAGDITYGGNCSSATSAVSAGNNTITFNSLSNGIHNNCTISVTDGSANTSNVLSITSFEVDNTMPDRFDGNPNGTQPSGTTSVEIYLNTWENATCRYSDTPNTVYADMSAMTNVTGGEDHGHDITGLVDGGSYTYYIRCTESSGNTNNDDFEIVFDITDETAPVITETTPVNTPTTDTTPDYVFNTDEAGTITYSGDCSSSDTTASSGNNTITFNELSVGVHNNCTITVTDNSSNISNVLNVSEFEIQQQQVAESNPLYRFWSKKNKSHFYTISETERDYIIATYSEDTWKYEGIAYNAPDKDAPNAVPVYRFWSKKHKGHFYTASLGERDLVISKYDDDVWKYEGIAYYAYKTYQENTKSVYRFWSSKNKHHFYTASQTERDLVISKYDNYTWAYEGVAWYVGE